MPSPASPASTVATLALPAPVGAGDAPIVDPTVNGLLSYLAYWIQYTLNPVLAVMSAPPVADACPTANRYACNPSSLVARYMAPALFAWWDGKSTTKQWTTMKDVRTRDIRVMYIFDRVASDTKSAVDARIRYAGLISTVDAAFTKAISRRAHPSYPSSGFRPGTPIGVMLGLTEIDYVGGQELFLAGLPTASARAAAVQPSGPARLNRGDSVGVVQGYPALAAVFRVVEVCGPDTVLPGDTMGDLFLDPTVGDDPSAPLALDERLLPSGDAVED